MRSQAWKNFVILSTLEVVSSMSRARLPTPLAAKIFRLFVGLALAAAAWPVRAQVARLERRPYLPGASSVDGAFGLELSENPAALAGGAGLVAAGAIGLRNATFDGDRGSCLALAARASLSVLTFAVQFDRSLQSAPPAAEDQSILGTSRISLGVAARLAGLVDLGMAVRRLGDLDAPADGVSPTTTFDIGMAAEPTPWLRLGMGMSDALAGTRHLFPAAALRGENSANRPILVGPQVVGGLRLGYHDRGPMVALDARWSDGQPIRSFALLAGWQVQPSWRVAVDVRWTVEDDPGGAGTRAGFVLEYRERRQRFTPHIHGDSGFSDGRSAAIGFGYRGAAQWLLDGGEAPNRPAARPRARARRQDRSRIAVSPEEAARIARAVLEVHAAFAAVDGARLCGLIASSGARLDVETSDPPLSLHVRAERAAICEQLRSRDGPFWAYLHAHGPGPQHAEAARLLPRLFRLHGGAYADLPPAKMLDYAQRLRREAPELRCRSYRARVYQSLGGVPAVEVRIDCPGEAIGVLQLLDEQGAYRLGKIAVDARRSE